MENILGNTELINRLINSLFLFDFKTNGNL